MTPSTIRGPTSPYSALDKREASHYRVTGPGRHLKSDRNTLKSASKHLKHAAVSVARFGHVHLHHSIALYSTLPLNQFGLLRLFSFSLLHCFNPTHEADYHYHYHHLFRFHLRGQDNEKGEQTHQEILRTISHPLFLTIAIAITIPPPYSLGFLSHTPQINAWQVPVHY